MLSEMVTSAPLERRQRKSLGAFYSPRLLVEPMVAWAVTGADQSVLDPSCGDGVFLETAAHRLRDLGAGPERISVLLHAVDLNPEAVRITRDRLVSELRVSLDNVRVGSFFALSPPGELFGAPERVDAVIGNPPYIRYQEFSGRARRDALERASDAGVRLNRLASSWAHFVAHAVAFLRPGGRLALILPAELIHATYAAPLREHLRRAFGEVHVVSFRQAVFPGVQEEVVLLLAAGKDGGPGRLGLTEVENGEDLPDLAALLAKAEVFSPEETAEKWIPGYTAHPGSLTLEHLQGRGLLAPLGDSGKAGIGFVSGANDYFVLTPGEAALQGLPDSSLQTALIRARQIPGLRKNPKGRPGSSDLDKRVKEAGLKTIDLKAEWARHAGQGGGPTSDLLTWLRQSKPLSFLFLAIRVVDAKDLERTLFFANAANQMMDAVGLVAYETKAVGDGYQPCKIPSHLELDRVLSRVCTALRNLP